MNVKSSQGGTSLAGCLPAIFIINDGEGILENTIESLSPRISWTDFTWWFWSAEQ
jgi:hypothetical protein